MRTVLICLTFVFLIGQIWADHDVVLEENERNSDTSSSSFSSSRDGNGPEQVHSSKSSTSVTQKCKNGECKTCINNKCFKGTDYTTIKVIDSCPAAACIKGCEKLVTAKDGCPMCSCGDGTGVREPCDSRSDCPSNATDCRKNACSYADVATDAPTSCQYTYECPSKQECKKGSCVASESEHVQGQRCTFTRECPSGHQCRDQTCIKGGPEHTNDVCVFDYQCPTKYSCEDMTCVYSGIEHGQSPCVSSSQCSDGQSCVKMTCQ